MKRGLLVLLLVGAGCTDFFAPMPGDPVLFGPPPQWIHWYHVAEDCSGWPRDVSQVRWYRYPGDHIPKGFFTQRHDAEAVTWEGAHKIAIADAFMFDSVVVIHESLHDISRQSGHPAAWFGPESPCAKVLGVVH